MSEMKLENRSLSDRIDSFEQNITAKIDSLKDVVTALAINMEKGFGGVEKSFGALRTARAFDRVWYLLMTGGILGIMARAFKWI
jgi:hypothetical protein